MLFHQRDCYVDSVERLLCCLCGELMLMHWIGYVVSLDRLHVVFSGEIIMLFHWRDCVVSV